MVTVEREVLVHARRPRGRGPLVRAQRPVVHGGALDAEIDTATCSAARPSGMVQFLGISGLTSRQPSAVDTAFDLSWKARSARGSTNGALRHAFDATRDHQVRVAGSDRPGGLHHGFAAGGAQPVHGHTGHARRQPGQQRDHPADVAVLLARAVGVAVDHVIDRGGVELALAVSREQFGRPAASPGRPPGSPDNPPRYLPNGVLAASMITAPMHRS